ncbi:crotonase/enoyl-CoA hydratase family protein [Oceanibacterium hippocampi]|uniref:Carnitinyl-CoA dehydratase n=1 Tax=Oceanibacterium hippocampi TaxID=745714 RepID=A0A1Y5S765_9PROT|nr:crotonase/enoyl-CoA hydratase family protein [Oceanibacterium hippocampi]SLN33990.1 Carnitinyl-CoA dehydratase [Oceanibacterium hippocampi]
MTEAAWDPKEGRVLQRPRGHVLMIGLDRPAKLNGFNPTMLRELAEAYSELENNAAYRVGVLYAEGENFTAGLELDKVAAHMKGGKPIVPDGEIDPLDLVRPRRTKPVVCAVQGYCYTIGIELMLAADIVVAAAGTRFSQLEVKRGIMATGGATLRMAERAGLGNAMLHLLTGDEFDAEEALRCNFVQRVVPDGDQLAHALEIAEAIAEQAPLAVQATMANARKAVEQGVEAAKAEFRPVQARLLESEDAAEGVRSFSERRQAKFTGR